MNRAANMLKEHEFTRGFMQGEYQLPLATTGILKNEDDPVFKCLIDISNQEQGYIADLKYTSSTLKGFPYEFIKWGYYLQASLYRDIAMKVFRSEERRVGRYSGRNAWKWCVNR